MGEPFDHCPPGGIRQSGKRCAQSIHNHMVVDYLAMSSVNFAIPDLSRFAGVSPRSLRTGARRRNPEPQPFAAKDLFDLGLNPPLLVPGGGIEPPQSFRTCGF